MTSILEMLGRETPLIVLVGSLFSILAGAGAAFGLPDLFWNGTREEPGHSQQSGRFETGLAVGIFLGEMIFVWLLVESRWRSWNPAHFAHLLVKGWLILGTFFILVWLRGAFTRTQLTAGEHSEVRWGGLLVAGVAIGMIGFGFLLEWLTARIPAGLSAIVAGVTPAPQGGLTLVDFHVTAAILVGLAVWGYLALRFLVRSIHPGAAICVLMIFLSGLHGFVAYRFGVGQILVYVLLASVYALLNSRWQRARVLQLESATRSHPAVSPLVADETALNAWRGQSAFKDCLPGLVVLSASGGGIRAALWSGVVLTGLETRWPEFPSRLRLITGASGGMLGAAEWTATLPGPPELQLHPQTVRDRVLDELELGGLKAVSSGLILRDLLPPPLRWGQDRGRRLESAWEAYSPLLANPLANLAPGERAGWRPSLVLTPTVVEDGRFLVISNLDLEPLLQSEGPPASDANMPLAIQGIQLFDYLPDAWGTLPLSTAVRLQANFPYVLPSTEVPGFKSGHLRVVDAGYRDDWGIEVATAWIASNRAWLAKNTSGVLLIQVRDKPSDWRLEPPLDKRGWLARGFDGLATPLEGLARAWERTAAFRNDEMVAELGRTMNNVSANPFFTTVIFELEQHVAPLTWSLTAAEATKIRGGLSSAKNRAALARAVAWSGGH